MYGCSSCPFNVDYCSNNSSFTDSPWPYLLIIIAALLSFPTTLIPVSLRFPISLTPIDAPIDKYSQQAPRETAMVSGLFSTN